jgi:uncharacterized membrane protein YdbT with pleckstrin-like domain
MSFSKDQLLPGEQLIIQVHQHWLVLLRPILLNIATLVVFAGISWASGRPVFLAFQIFPLAFLGWEFLVWKNREFVLTDHRVVKQEGVFSISSFDASLDKINNIFHEQSFAGRMLKYGSVGLETASEQGTTVFDFIADPVNFKNSIVQQRELYKSMADKLSSQPGASIPRMIDELASLRDRGLITGEEFESKKKSLLAKL